MNWIKSRIAVGIVRAMKDDTKEAIGFTLDAVAEVACAMFMALRDPKAKPHLDELTRIAEEAIEQIEALANIVREDEDFGRAFALMEFNIKDASAHLRRLRDHVRKLTS